MSLSSSPTPRRLAKTGAHLEGGIWYLLHLLVRHDQARMTVGRAPEKDPLTKNGTITTPPSRNRLGFRLAQFWTQAKFASFVVAFTRAVTSCSRHSQIPR